LKKRTYNLHFDDLVIGADLSALSYAYVNKIPFIYVGRKKPLFNERLSTKILGIDNSLILWERLATHLGLAGLDPFGNYITGISIRNSTNLMLATEGVCTYHISFNRVFVSDDDSISGLPEVIMGKNKMSSVIDYFKLHKLSPVDIKSDDDFLYSVKDYDDEEKFIVGYSKLTDEELDSPDFNINVARIKLKRMLKSIDYPFSDLQHNKREVKTISKTQYKEEETIKFIYESPEDIFKNRIIENVSDKTLRNILDDDKIGDAFSRYYNDSGLGG
jgi:hypothetical protein